VIQAVTVCMGKMVLTLSWRILEVLPREGHFYSMSHFPRVFTYIISCILVPRKEGSAELSHRGNTDCGNGSDASIPAPTWRFRKEYICLGKWVT
jgi:hypothetical protein